MTVDVMLPAAGQLWRRKRDGVLIAIRRDPELKGYSFAYVQNLKTGKHFEVTAAGIRIKYEFVGYDHSADEASMHLGSEEER